MLSARMLVVGLNALVVAVQQAAAAATVSRAPPSTSAVFVHSTRTPAGDFFPCTRVPSALAIPNTPVRLALAECRRWVGDGCYPAGLPTPTNETQVGSNRYVCLRRSVDGGATFLALDPNITGMRGTNPSAVWDLHASAVRVFFTACDTAQGTSGIHSVMSTDLGASWSRPVQQISEATGEPLLGSVGPGHGVISTRLPNGSVLLALAAHTHHPKPVGTPAHTFESWVYTSMMGGDSHWRQAKASLPYIGETQLVALRDGTIMLNSRCADGGHGPGHPPTQHYFTPCHCHNRAIATSTDSGESFGPISFDKGLPDPDCQGAIMQLEGEPQGRVAFSNPASRHGRANMTLHVSADARGRVWVQPGTLLSAAATLAPPWSDASLGAYSALMYAHNGSTTTAGLVGTVWEGGHTGCEGPSCAIYVSWSELPIGLKTDDLATPLDGSINALSASAMTTSTSGGDVTYFVSSAKGNDGASGLSENAPWRTLVHAQAMARVAIRRGSAVSVTLLGGVYRVNQTLAFDARDSGSTWQAAPGTSPRITASVSVSLKNFRAVGSDPRIAPEAVGKVVSAKLADVAPGLEIGTGFAGWSFRDPNRLEVFANEKTLTLARFPNIGVAVTGSEFTGYASGSEGYSAPSPNSSSRLEAQSACSCAPRFGICPPACMPNAKSNAIRY